MFYFFITVIACIWNKYGIYFLWASLGMFLLAQKKSLCEESDYYLFNI